jgi:lipoprotein-anchoring transpeptidase ErfK/SrfK
MRWSIGVVMLGAWMASAPSAPASGVRLSDERTYTRSAEALRAAPIRRGPTTRTPRVGRLRRWTEDRVPEVYLLLRRHGRWTQVRIPGRPNGRVGWVPSEALAPARLTRWALEIDRRRLRARLAYAGRVVWTAPVGIGAAGTPTPAGRYWIREKLRVPGHTLYGPWALGTSAYSSLSDWPGGGVVGLHGTDQPRLIPGRPSHGCVRLRNADIRHLARHLPVGAPVRIR